MTPLRATYRWSEEDKIGRFVSTILDYIESISDSATPSFSNAPRETILESLRRIAVGDKFHKGLSPSQKAEGEIVEKMWKMLKSYTNIQHAYQRARTDMLG